MESATFQFKQFTIKQDRCAFKVGTDSVLLGSWADPESAKQILDIGTGSGLLALMMAQKNNTATITAIDIDQDAYSQAKENAEYSPWRQQVQVHHASLQDFTRDHSQRFDLIITNPPYFNSKAHANDSAKSTARNTSRLQFKELIQSSIKLLEENGKFYVVLPTAEAIEFRKIAEKEGLVLAQLLRVQTKPGSSYEKRHLMQFQKTAFLYSEEVLVIEHEEHHQYTDDYRSLTQDFYLAF